MKTNSKKYSLLSAHQTDNEKTKHMRNLGNGHHQPTSWYPAKQTSFHFQLSKKEKPKPSMQFSH